MKHTILGAGGAIANALTSELLKEGETVRLVSRSGYSVAGTESYRADITSYEETLKSIRNSDIVHLCVGLPNNSEIWYDQWPKIMRNTIDACKSSGARLVFFDNAYMYGKISGKMTEATPYNPCSRKGEIRAGVALMLQREMEQNNIKAIIARAADLYGPFATKTSFLSTLVINALIKKKRAKWLVDSDTYHSFSYTRDCAEAIVLLSRYDTCYSQVWHLPTAKPVTGDTYIHIIANVLGTDPDYYVLDKRQVKTSGLFNKAAYELYEMLYQFEYNFYFDSTKFNDFFCCSPISYFKGVSETIDYISKMHPDSKLRDTSLKLSNQLSDSSLMPVQY